MSVPDELLSYVLNFPKNSPTFELLPRFISPQISPLVESLFSHFPVKFPSNHSSEISADFPSEKYVAVANMLLTRRKTIKSTEINMFFLLYFIDIVEYSPNNLLYINY